jgi:hypothetical protein
MSAMVDCSGRGVVLYLHVPSCHGSLTGSICSVCPPLPRHEYGLMCSRTMPRKLTDIAVPDVLEVYPLMFIGVVGSNLVSHLADVNLSRALTVWIFALVASGKQLPDALNKG